MHKASSTQPADVQLSQLLAQQPCGCCSYCSCLVDLLHSGAATACAAGVGTAAHAATHAAHVGHATASTIHCGTQRTGTARAGPSASGERTSAVEALLTQPGDGSCMQCECVRACERLQCSGASQLTFLDDGVAHALQLLLLVLKLLHLSQLVGLQPVNHLCATNTQGSTRKSAAPATTSAASRFHSTISTTQHSCLCCHTQAVVTPQ